MNRVLILGGYGNFGKRIAAALAKSATPIILAGRNAEKLSELTARLKNEFPQAIIEQAVFDAKTELADRLKELNPAVVINTVGPFQTSNYFIAETCIEHKTHYIDLADGRDFVVGIFELNDRAKKAGVAVIGGASSVPGLSSAVLEKYKAEFSEIDAMIYGISPGQKAERGLATTAGILTYVGKRLKASAGSTEIRYGWQDIYLQKYPELGNRLMANCDIPDLDLFPQKYGIKEIRFSAGMENRLLHLGIWLISLLIRLGVPINLPKYAASLLRLSHMFDKYGTADGGMHIIIRGKNKDGKAHEIKWFIIAKDGDGPHIPTIPAIILAKKLAAGTLDYRGACACIGMVFLEEYLQELSSYNIKNFCITD